MYLNRRVFVMNGLQIYLSSDKRGICVIFFLFLQKNIYCRYSLDASQHGASTDYQHYTFSWRNKEKKNCVLSGVMRQEEYFNYMYTCIFR